MKTPYRLSLWLATVATAVSCWSPALAAPAEAEDAQDPPRKVREPGEDAPSTSPVQQLQDVVRVFGNVALRRGQTAPNVVAVFGNTEVDGDVTEDVVTVFGNTRVNAKVGGDVVGVFGTVDLGPKAAVDGQVVSVGGTLQADPAAVIRGQQTEVAIGHLLPELGWLKTYVLKGLVWGRLIVPSQTWIWGVVGFFFLLYAFTLLVLPRPVEVCARVLERQPLEAFLVGLLAFVLSGPISLILTATGVGLLVIPFLMAAIVAALIVGKTAVMYALGLRVLRRPTSEPQPSAILALVVGFALLTLAYMIPVLGVVTWCVALTLAFGAALLAMFAAFRKDGPRPPLSGDGAGVGASGAWSGTGPAASSLATAVPALAAPGVGAESGAPPAASGDAVAPARTSGTEAGTGTGTGAAMGESVSPPHLGAAALGATGLASAELASAMRAGFWQRTGATALDFALVFGVLAFLDHRGFFLVAWILYHLAFWTWKGTTIGGAVLGLKCVRLDGRPLDLGLAVVRVLGAFLSAIVLFLGFFWVGWAEDKLAWHDKIAGTAIVKVPPGTPLF